MTARSVSLTIKPFTRASVMLRMCHIRPVNGFVGAQQHYLQGETTMTLQNWASVSKKMLKIGLKSAGDIFAMRLLCDNDDDFVKFVEKLYYIIAVL